jgi:O-acetyl-ADP-ribose deacetylase (regulator of RNase III)
MIQKQSSVMVKIECLRGDITDQPDMDVIVNAANAQLLPGGGVAGAIHGKAGPGLAEECRTLAPIRAGEAVITGAHQLPNKHIIHCLGPVYGIDSPEAKLLASCYRSALNLAETHGLASIAFPAISTGIFGYPVREAAEVSLCTVRDFNAYRNLRHVRFVLWSEQDWKTYNHIKEELFKHQPGFT